MPMGLLRRAGYEAETMDVSVEGFDADNPYHSVAMIYVGFLCDRCGTYCSGKPAGTREDEPVPYRVLAETAQRCGWLVEDQDAGLSSSRRESGSTLPHSKGLAYRPTSPASNST